jgi:lysophospholipase
MIGIKVFRKISQSIALAATSILSIIAGKSYVTGGGDWSKSSSKARLTSDIIRGAVQDKWSAADKTLRTGGITFGWLYEAQESCIKLQNRNIHTKITTPCLFGIAENDDLVDNIMTKKIANNINNAKIIELPQSFHEILMEKDDIRDVFLKNFYNLIKESIIERPETLKPF